MTMFLIKSTPAFLVPVACLIVMVLYSRQQKRRQQPEDWRVLWALAVVGIGGGSLMYWL